MEEAKIAYREAVKEIEQIIEKIEGEELDVDELASQVKRAGELLNLCKSRLKNTEEDLSRTLEEL